MRFLSTILAPVLASGGDGLPARLASEAEERAYEAREALSPEVQEFVGGDGSGVFVALLVIGFLVFLVLYFGPEIKKNA